MEEWRVVEGWNDKYKVSNTGRVWNTLTNVEVSQVLTGVPQYKYVNLHLAGQKSKLVRVHRLVAMAFVEGQDEKYNVVDHIDRDKLNNDSTNLRWTDHSGNQRNTEQNVYVFGEYLKDYVERYENPSAAYSYLTTRLREGLSDDEAVSRYQENLDYGVRKLIVQWEGEDVYLEDLCKQRGLDYLRVTPKLNAGVALWNIITGIPPIESYLYCVEIPSNIVTGYWFSTLHQAQESFSTGGDKVTEMIKSGRSYEDILEYDQYDYKRQTVRGVYGTIKELCDHFGVSEGAVSTNMTRKGMTPEEALFAPRQRVKRLSINGVYNSPKYWYESFGINAKTANKYKSTSGKGFKETFEHFGVDTSEMVISIV